MTDSDRSRRLSIAAHAMMRLADMLSKAVDNGMEISVKEQAGVRRSVKPSRGTSKKLPRVVKLDGTYEFHVSITEPK